MAINQITLNWTPTTVVLSRISSYDRTEDAEFLPSVSYSYARAAAISGSQAEPPILLTVSGFISASERSLLESLYTRSKRAARLRQAIGLIVTDEFRPFQEAVDNTAITPATRSRVGVATALADGLTWEYYARFQMQLTELQIEPSTASGHPFTLTLSELDILKA